MSMKVRIDKIEKLIIVLQKFHKFWDESKIEKYYNSEFIDTFWMVLDDTQKVLLTANEHEWVNWFIYDNEFGNRKLSCTIGKKKYIISNLKDFVKFLGDLNDVNS
jgi:hypothetical protein